MGYVKIWVHLVWSTKNRQPLLSKEIRHRVFEHIKENARQKGIYVDHINGYIEHVHCLISLKSGQTIDNVLFLLKGESSFWINKTKMVQGHFDWQKGYFAVSVSESLVPGLRYYIRNQENHHKKKSFLDEFNEFMRKFGFDKLSEEDDISG